MRFLTLIINDGDGKRAIAVNMDHVIKVDHDKDELVIHLSNGNTHSVDKDSENDLRKLLQIASQATKENPTK